MGGHADSGGAGQLYPGGGGAGLYPVRHEPDDRVAGRRAVHQAADPLPHRGPANAGGAELYPYVERLVGQYWAAQEKANEIKGLETGVVRMGTLASISVHWLPGLLRDFQARYPPAWSSCSSAKNFKKKFENRSCIFWRSVVTYTS